MSLYKRGDVWWYKFWFNGQLIRESSKSDSKTAAKDAERARRKPTIAFRSVNAFRYFLMRRMCGSRIRQVSRRRARNDMSSAWCTSKKSLVRLLCVM